MQELLGEVNQRAENEVWKRSKDGIAVRLSGCRVIVDPAVKMVMSMSKGRGYDAVPQSLGDKLDEVFTRHYQEDNYLLIGRTEDEAHAAQEGYAREVVNLLPCEPDCHRSRAMVRLGMVHGYPPIPLLCVRSIDAMWKACCSNFYARQLSLVRSTHPDAGYFSDFQPSFTGGLNHSQSLWGAVGLGVTTYRPSNASS